MGDEAEGDFAALRPAEAVSHGLGPALRLTSILKPSGHAWRLEKSAKTDIETRFAALVGETGLEHELRSYAHSVL